MSFSLLPYISFALSLGGLVVRLFLPSDSRKITVLGIVVTCLVVITGVGIYQAISHKRHVEATATEIITTLRSGTKTLDEVHENLYKADFRITTEALDGLVATNKVGQKILKVRDDLGRRFRVRAYYLITEANKAKLTRHPWSRNDSTLRLPIEEESQTQPLQRAPEIPSAAEANGMVVVTSSTAGGLLPAPLSGEPSYAIAHCEPYAILDK